MSKKQTIYALFAAINDYPEGTKKLQGCLADMELFRKYLSTQRRKDFIIKEKVLEQTDVTRDNLIQAFQHFQSATEGDICLFFFSGHGALVPTSEFWEVNKGLDEGNTEALVCYDSCLIDKELSCLIYETLQGKPQVQFIAIMDCCHSGDITRAFEDPIGVKLTVAKVYPKTIKEYYGYNKGLYQEKNGKYAALEAAHITLSACQSHELARELMIGTEIRGAFTASLVEALETSNTPLSYIDLESRIAQKISNRTAEQTPRIDTLNRADLQKTFLNGAVTPKNRYFISYNNRTKTWKLNAGKMQGINLNSRIPSVIRLKDGSELFQIESVSATESIGKWQNPDFRPITAVQYDVNVRIGGVTAQTLAFYEHGAAFDHSTKTAVKNRFDEGGITYVELTDDLSKARFFIHCEKDKIWLRSINSDNPVFTPITFDAIEAIDADEFWRKTDAVMVWHHLKNLDNANSRLSLEDVNITLYRKEGEENWAIQPDEMEQISNWQQPTVFNYFNEVRPFMALSIENTSTESLFVAALLMDQRFGIHTQFLPCQKVDPKQKVFLSISNQNITSQLIQLSINAELINLGRTQQSDFAKIIVSTEQFNTNNFQQDPLSISDRFMGQSRGIGDEPEVKTPDWVSFLLPICTNKPKIE